ncbi:Aste57867_4007 [Aphanomyces stellatus]|uniref:Aste57867_4007 protein n=1 Tax=Aphanomyces stellatus TaxID=120398 RepID=A0A485KEP3_9STRA|nr:hypothetical protein As57867_003996 [Aphanomyces stellatus]VFT81142.1 Aste57867_4007 [Aphanomyces stellatus]
MSGPRDTPKDKQERSEKNNEANKTKRLLNDALMLRDRQSPTEVERLLKKGGWANLLHRLEEREQSLASQAALFAKEEKTKEYLHNVKEIVRDAASLPDRRRLTLPPFHINQVVQALHLHPSPLLLQDAAWPILGGVCSNCFPLAERLDIDLLHEMTWRNRPLPMLPLAREIAVNWITSVLHRYAGRLVQHCEVATADAAAAGDCRTLVIPCASDSVYMEERSEVHLVHLASLATYHVTKFRKHRVKLSFETMVNVRKERYHGNLTSKPPLETFPTSAAHDIALSQVCSAYNDTATQCILTRQFEDADQYCVLACAITHDEKPWTKTTQREWVSWTMIQRNADGTATMTQLAIGTGLQHEDGRFIPYDEKESFEALVTHLEAHYKEAFEKDAKRTRTALGAMYTPPIAPKLFRPPSTTQVFIAPPRVDRRRPRQEASTSEAKKRIRGDIFDAVTSLQKFTDVFNDEEIAAFVGYMTDRPLHATAFVAMESSPALQRAWLLKIPQQAL